MAKIVIEVNCGKEMCLKCKQRIKSSRGTDKCRAFGQDLFLRVNDPMYESYRLRECLAAEVRVMVGSERFRIFAEIGQERKRQDEKFGEQNYPMVRVLDHIGQNKKIADGLKTVNSITEGKDWCSILLEEVYEAFAETEPEKQREEIIQVAAVAVNIIEYLERRIK